MYLKYSKLRAWAKSPERANPSDAGMDVFWCPSRDNQRLSFIAPNTCKVLETGLKFEIPHGYMLKVENKSGIASKKGLLVGACVIDSGYEGEVFINLWNVSNETVEIESGQKIAQLVMVPVIKPQLIEVKEGELYSEPVTISDRGDGGFGSTGV